MTETPILQVASRFQGEASKHRRHLHQHPELAFEEVNTSDYICDELLRLGFEVHRGFGKTGLYGAMCTKREGPRYLLRFDMDALALQERTEHGFTSQRAGLMHACGHDGHVAIGLTVAAVLAEICSELSGSYYLLFQPAEEIGKGAAAMIADGVLDGIRPDYAMAVHLWAEKPVGWLAITPGPFMAGAVDLDLKVHGVGGHGALPHKAADPILASAHLITALQAVVSRSVDPLQNAVYSITQIHAGTNNNVIPDLVRLSGKPRFFTTDVEAQIYSSTRRICAGVAGAFGCQIEVRFENRIPPTVNNPMVTRQAALSAARMKPDLVIDETMQTMGSEDMGLFLERVPGAMFFVGAGKTDPKERFPLHHPCFDIDESSLVLAAAFLLETCQQLAGNG